MLGPGLGPGHRGHGAGADSDAKLNRPLDVSEAVLPNGATVLDTHFFFVMKNFLLANLMKRSSCYSIGASLKQSNSVTNREDKP